MEIRPQVDMVQEEIKKTNNTVLTVLDNCFAAGDISDIISRKASASLLKRLVEIV